MFFLQHGCGYIYMYIEAAAGPLASVLLTIAASSLYTSLQTLSLPYTYKVYILYMQY